MIGDVLAGFFTWAAQQELESIRRRTKAGLDKARSNETLGTPRKMTDLKVEMARSFRRGGLSFKQIGTALGCLAQRWPGHSGKVEGKVRIGERPSFGSGSFPSYSVYLVLYPHVEFFSRFCYRSFKVLHVLAERVEQLHSD